VYGLYGLWIVSNLSHADKSFDQEKRGFEFERIAHPKVQIGGMLPQIPAQLLINAHLVQLPIEPAKMIPLCSIKTI
jgi:hypothetical protein